MRTVQPTIAGLVRSEAQGKILAELLLHPRREYTLSELAELTEESKPTVHREVNRLTETGIASDRRVGRNRLVTAGTENPVVPPLTQIVMLTYGPLPALRQALADVPGVEEAHIFGSWAARMRGEVGPFPADVDVLVVGEVSKLDMYELIAPVEKCVGYPVNPSVVSRDQWESEDDPFIRTIRERPLVRILLEAGS